MVFLVDQQYPSVFFGIGFKDLQRSIRRTVIDTDDLKFLMILTDNAVQTLTEPRSSIINSDYDTDKRIIHAIIIHNFAINSLFKSVYS